MRLILFFTLCSFLSTTYAQLNMELLSEVTYPGSIGNDVWGYVSPEGDEYAIMGTFDGVSIVNITDPRNPVEVDFIDQQGSTWRDMKTWGEFAYVTADEPGTTDGLLVIDMSSLPDSITFENQNLELPSGEIINTCHNIYIDEFGFAYLAGCGDINNGGLLMWDVRTTPGTPIFAGLGAPEYSHDVYVRNNLAYSSEISRTPQTTFSIYDVSDKSNVMTLGSQTTTGNATHNAWLSDDSNTLFTTDEVANAPIGSYDVSDPSNITLLDEYRPTETLGTGVVPHNVHVWNDWLIISYYTDGCKVVDASRPGNLIEVGNFDTFFGPGAGFNGAWGAYPFFPSGTVVLGDMGIDNTNGAENGRLVVLAPTYVRASYLEGNVTDAVTGNPINNASVTSTDIGIIEFSKADGVYKTGSHLTGDFEVTVDAFGYAAESRTVTLENGVLTTENFILTPSERVSVSGIVVDETTNDPIENAQVKIIIDGFQYDAISDAMGQFLIEDFVTGTYDIIVGKWGYNYSIIADENISGVNPVYDLTINLSEGFQDLFSLDLGWETTFFGLQGAWERGVPIGQEAGGGPDILLAPGFDSDDAGDECYVTGNDQDLFNGVLFGEAVLISPSFDVSSMAKAVMTYDTWFWVSSFNGFPDSEDFIISIDNGIDIVPIDTIEFDLSGIINGIEVTEWKSSGDIVIEDYIDITDDMRLVLNISESGFDSAVEGGLDNFKIVDALNSSIGNLAISENLRIFPNPSQDRFTVLIPDDLDNQELKMTILDINGRVVESTTSYQSDRFSFGENLQQGVYMIQLIGQNYRSPQTRIIKM